MQPDPTSQGSYCSVTCVRPKPKKRKRDREYVAVRVLYCNNNNRQSKSICHNTANNETNGDDDNRSEWVRDGCHSFIHSPNYPTWIQRRLVFVAVLLKRLASCGIWRCYFIILFISNAGDRRNKRGFNNYSSKLASCSAFLNFQNLYSLSIDEKNIFF